MDWNITNEENFRAYFYGLLDSKRIAMKQAQLEYELILYIYEEFLGGKND